jgi:hypothetical protein
LTIEALVHNHRTRLQVTMKVEDQLTLILAKLDDQSKGIHGINRKITDV